jgi:hypothetical protein
VVVADAAVRHAPGAGIGDLGDVLADRRGTAEVERSTLDGPHLPGGEQVIVDRDLEGAPHLEQMIQDIP